MTPAERHARFLAVVARAIARADREQAEHLDRIRRGASVDHATGWRAEGAAAMKRRSISTQE